MYRLESIGRIRSLEPEVKNARQRVEHPSPQRRPLGNLSNVVNSPSMMKPGHTFVGNARSPYLKSPGGTERKVAVGQKLGEGAQKTVFRANTHFRGEDGEVCSIQLALTRSRQLGLGRNKMPSGHPFEPLPIGESRYVQLSRVGNPVNLDELTLEERLTLCEDIATELSNYHEKKGRCHLDVKFENILFKIVDGRKKFFLIDYDCAKENKMPTETVGTFKNMAPELWPGLPPNYGVTILAEPYLDVWSLGSLIVEALTKKKFMAYVAEVKVDYDGGNRDDYLDGIGSYKIAFDTVMKRPEYKAGLTRRISTDILVSLLEASEYKDNIATNQLKGEISSLIFKCLDLDPDKRPQANAGNLMFSKCLQELRRIKSSQMKTQFGSQAKNDIASLESGFGEGEGEPTQPDDY